MSEMLGYMECVFSLFFFFHLTPPSAEAAVPENSNVPRRTFRVGQRLKENDLEGFLGGGLTISVVVIDSDP